MKIKEPSKFIKDIAKKINRKDIFSIIIVFILGIINNFNFIITEGIAPDALAISDFNIAGNWETSLGRFGIKYVNSMRFGLVNKLIIILICLTFLSISCLIIIRIFKVRNKILVFLISALVAVAPQFTATYMFIYCADAYCLAFLFATLGVYFLTQIDNKRIFYLLSIVSTIIVCSLYQAYLGVLIGLTIILLIKYILENIDTKELLIKGLKYIVTILIGVTLYYLLLKLIVFMLDISIASYKGANNIGLDTILALPKTILQTYKDFFKFFFTDKIINNIYWKRISIYIILFSVSIVNLIYIVFKNKLDNKIIKIILMILLLGVYPIGISIMNLISPETKVNLVSGPGLITVIMVMVIIYQNLNDITFDNFIKYLYIIGSTLLIITFVLQNTYTYMSRQQTFRNYYTVSNDIYSRATQIDNYSEDAEWMFSDVIRYNVKNIERTNGFISKDNMTWNNYDGILQNYNYFQKYLGINIKICSKEKYDEIIKTDVFKKMPIYPKKGCIKMIDNVVVIKISDKTF